MLGDCVAAGVNAVGRVSEMCPKVLDEFDSGVGHDRGERSTRWEGRHTRRLVRRDVRLKECICGLV